MKLWDSFMLPLEQFPVITPDNTRRNVSLDHLTLTLRLSEVSSTLDRYLPFL